MDYSPKKMQEKLDNNSFSLKKKFGMIIEEYLESREDLQMVFMLVDFRHKPTEDDILMYNEFPDEVLTQKITNLYTKNLHKISPMPYYYNKGYLE